MHKTPVNVRADMVEWLPENIAWVRMISKTILGHKKIELHNYLSYLVPPGFKYDKITLLITAYMYDFHIVVILNGKYWSTMAKHDIYKGHVFLAYFGKLKFKLDFALATPKTTPAAAETPAVTPTSPAAVVPQNSPVKSPVKPVTPPQNSPAKSPRPVSLWHHTVAAIAAIITSKFIWKEPCQDAPSTSSASRPNPCPSLTPSP